MLKKILIGLLVLIGLAVGLAMWGTSGMTKTAEEFFADIGKGDYTKAYAYLSEDFKHTVSRDQLKAFMEANGLTDYKSASWGNRSFEGKRGVIEGSIETRSGSAVPLTMKFIKMDSGEWKIYSISKPQAGIKTEKDMSLPSKDQIKKMIKRSIHDFAVSANSKNMKHLYETMSSMFKNQYTLEKFNAIFQPYFKMNSDFTVLDRFEPVITKEASIDSDGIMEIKGYYPTKPSRFTFELGYIQENGEWKLNGIYTALKNNETEKKTSSASDKSQKTDYTDLVKKTIHAFSVSVKENSMQKTYDDLASAVKKKVSVEDLNGMFKSYLNKNIDLGETDGMKPVFDKVPAIGNDGVLRADGHYSLKNGTTLNFKLEYIREDSIWKLVGMNIDLK